MQPNALIALVTFVEQDRRRREGPPERERQEHPRRRFGLLRRAR